MARIASRPTRNTPRRLTADQPVELGGGGVEQRLLDQDAGIVDQDVEPPRRWQGGIEHGQDLGLVGNVGPTGECPTATGATSSDPRRPGPVGDRDLAALGRQRQDVGRRCRWRRR